MQMLKLVLIVLAGWQVVQLAFLVKWVVQRKRQVLRWGPGDLWQFPVHAVFITALVTVLMQGYQP